MNKTFNFYKQIIFYKSVKNNFQEFKTKDVENISKTKSAVEVLKQIGNENK